MSAEKFSEYVFTWKIRNYSSCYQVKGEFIKSPFFMVENMPDIKWNLCLYPKADSRANDSESFISVFLESIVLNESARVIISYSIEMVDEKDRGLQLVSVKNKEFNKQGRSWGWVKFFDAKELEKEINSSSEDVLTLRCRIKSDNQNKQIEHSKSTACTTIEVDRCCVKWYLEMLSQFKYSEKLAFQICDDSYDLEITLNSTEEMLGISVHFEDNESKSSQLLTLTFSLFDKTGCKLGSKRAWHLCKHDETWEFPDFITKELLKRCEMSSFKYEFKLMCEVSISKKSMTSFIEILEFETPRCLKSKENDMPTSAMKNNYRKFFLNKTYSDAIIRCKQEDFPVHKFVLKVQSPVFAAMFDQDMLENKTGVVNMADIDEDTLKAFLEFLYTDTVNKMDYELAKNLLLAADKYQVPSIVDECSSFLKSILCTANVCEVIAIADMIGCEHLKSYALNFIKVNASEILPTPDWTKWIKGNITLATDILSKLSAAIGTNYKLI